MENLHLELNLDQALALSGCITHRVIQLCANYKRLSDFGSKRAATNRSQINELTDIAYALNHYVEQSLLEHEALCRAYPVPLL